VVRSSIVARILEECEQRYIVKALHLIKISSIVHISPTPLLVVLIFMPEAAFCAKDKSSIFYETVVSETCAVFFS
jgi:hypothetical protein